MNRQLSGVLLCVAGSVACAQPAITTVETGYLITSLSQNGSVGAGNSVGDGTYETFHWVRDVGITRLGQGTVATIGVGAGSPDISRDGTRISASILGQSGYITPGIWTEGQGWEDSLPPLAPNGVLLDNAYGSAWGLSGDGHTLCGLYWKTPGAQPFNWTASGGIQALPIAHRSGRANATNYDGTVTVGWMENSWGGWEPQAWRNGVRYALNNTEDVGSMGQGVNHDGSVIVGNAFDPSDQTRHATIWRWNGSGYSIERLENLDLVVPTLGQGYLSGVTDDGTTAVGSAVATNNPGGDRAAVIWRQGRGQVTAEQWLTELGVWDQIPASWIIREGGAISPDGSTVSLIAIDFAKGSFVNIIVQFCTSDVTRDGEVDFADFLAFFNAFDQSTPTADIDGVYGTDFGDFLAFFNSFDAGC